MPKTVLWATITFLSITVHSITTPAPIIQSFPILQFVEIVTRSEMCVLSSIITPSQMIEYAPIKTFLPILAVLWIIADGWILFCLLFIWYSFKYFFKIFENPFLGWFKGILIIFLFKNLIFFFSTIQMPAETSLKLLFIFVKKDNLFFYKFSN